MARLWQRVSGQRPDVPQPSYVNPGHNADDDLLSSFDPEGPAPPPPSRPVTLPAVTAEPVEVSPDQPSVSLDQPSVVDDLRAKLDLAELEIKRSAVEVATLRTQLATIVSKVRDIERQLGPSVERSASRALPATARRTRPIVGAAALALLVLANAIAWYPILAPVPIDRMDPLVTSEAVAPEPAAPFALVSSALASTAETLSAAAPPTAEPPAAAPPAAKPPATEPPAAAPLATAPPAIREPQVVQAASRGSQQFLGTLLVQTVPAGAAVFVNRTPVGQTPLRVPDLRAGSHLVWLERDGYKRWTSVVTVPADQITRISAQLQPY